MTRARLLAVLLLAFALPSAPSHAAPGQATLDAEREALGLLGRGTELFEKARYDEARRAFQAAQALMPNKANPYRWLGLSDVRLGDCPRALDELAAFRRRVAANDARLVEVAEAEATCRRVLAEEEARRPAPVVTPAPPTDAATTAVVSSPPAVVAAAHPEPPPPSFARRHWWIFPVAGVLVAAGAATGMAIALQPSPDCGATTLGCLYPR